MFERLIARLPDGALPPGDGVTAARVVVLFAYLVVIVMIVTFIASFIYGAAGGEPIDRPRRRVAAGPVGAATPGGRWTGRGASRRRRRDPGSRCPEGCRW